MSPHEDIHVGRKAPGLGNSCLATNIQAKVLQAFQPQHKSMLIASTLFSEQKLDGGETIAGVQSIWKAYLTDWSLVSSE